MDQMGKKNIVGMYPNHMLLQYKNAGVCLELKDRVEVLAIFTDGPEAVWKEADIEAESR